MTTDQKREPKEPLRIPLDFEQTLADMLKVKPPLDHEKRGATKKAQPAVKKTKK